MKKYTHEELVAKAEEIAALVEEAQNKIRAAKETADDFGLYFEFQLEEEMYPISYSGVKNSEKYQYEFVVDSNGVPIEIDYSEYKTRLGGLDHSKIYRNFPGAKIVTRGWSPSTLRC